MTAACDVVLKASWLKFHIKNGEEPSIAGTSWMDARGRRVEGDEQILEIRKTNPSIQRLMKEFLHVDSMILRPVQNQEEKFS